MRELLKKLVGIEPMTEDEKESVLLALIICPFLLAMMFFAAILG